MQQQVCQYDMTFHKPCKEGTPQVYGTGQAKEQKELWKMCDLTRPLESCVRTECRSGAEMVKGEECGPMQPCFA